MVAVSGAPTASAAALAVAVAASTQPQKGIHLLGARVAFQGCCQLGRLRTVGMVWSKRAAETLAPVWQSLTLSKSNWVAAAGQLKAALQPLKGQELASAGLVLVRLSTTCWQRTRLLLSRSMPAQRRRQSHNQPTRHQLQHAQRSK